MNYIKIKNHDIKFKTEPIKYESGIYYFIFDDKLNYFQRTGDVNINKIKSLLKKYSLVYEILRNCLYPILMVGGKSRKDFLKINFDEKQIIVNLASGNNTENYFINVDLFPFNKVDIIASTDDLPFADNSIDKIILEASIEHVTNPNKTIEEIHRVLKKGGMLFMTVPFIVGYHDSPSDYWRWTKEGLKLLLKDFEIVEIGNKGGIASALGWILAEFIATALSFNSRKFHFILFHIMLILLMPLKLLDFVFNSYTTTSNISSLFYATCKKK